MNKKTYWKVEDNIMYAIIAAFLFYFILRVIV
jgi:hypothetical protein